MKDKIKELRIRIDGLSQLVKELKPFQKWRLDISKIPDGLTLEQHLEIFNKENVDLSNSIEPIPNQYKELEKSYDSLILAKCWLGKVLGELGEETPYKNDGKRKDVKDIEETADTQELTYAKGSTDNHNGILNYENKTHIEKIDCLREEIKKVVDVIAKDMPTTMLDFAQLKTISNCFKTTYQHLSEARFWLGFELSRCRDEEK